MNDVVLGGAPIGELDVGYGPARYLSPAEVKEVFEALNGLDWESLDDRYSAELYE